ncbi:LysM peptidoglycan-binding domain-containing protein [Flexivirga sp. ID2601S]|uniref:LysM peptidoglycan-binding domain-containing protein n=1 Tax=Flexivirga aerilata TaxID=1656889 RepID=A0A849AI16_9MICO|nr:LysM peptidoglycan-binding domain-containing protein [Flexivirga aerilata]NNG39583.1 LysM peptidoglycan-binding domain-containing protein [Flexivirga aerilata]
MSAVTQWEIPATVPPRPRRRLRSVPTGAGATASVAGVPQRRAVPAQIGVRLTARGRRLLVAAAVVILCLSGAFVARAWAAPSAPAVPSVTVQPGQTLSEVAHRAYPQLTTGDAVTKVQQANSLNSLQVHAGQRLSLPR